MRFVVKDSDSHEILFDIKIKEYTEYCNSWDEKWFYVTKDTKGETKVVEK